jgi:hypothetical protein
MIEGAERSIAEKRVIEIDAMLGAEVAGTPS